MKTNKTMSERVVELQALQERADAAKAEAMAKSKEAPAKPSEAAGLAVEKAAGEGAASVEVKPEQAVALRKAKKMEEINEEGRDLLLIGAEKLNLIELRDLLRGYGLEVSTATLSRHLRKWRAERALVAGEDLREAAEKFAARGGSVAREGAVAAVREKVFERVVSCKDPAEAMRMYEALVGEEERLKKLALDERKARAQEKMLVLREERLWLEAGQAGAKLFLEALRILRDEGLEDEVKVARARAALEAWRVRDAIEVERGVSEEKALIRKE